MNSTALPMVEVQGVSKRYRLGAPGAGSLRGMLDNLFRRGPRPAKAPSTLGAREGDQPGTFWSLRDVSFNVQPGEVVGLAGRNGAGKSTLLKVLSRITEPTKGRVRLRGRVASLLEVGTGFHPELTGRENIFLNGAILGMKRWEIAAKFKEIVDFSEVGTFLDSPVKHYSSGMFVRLAFAVAAHLEPEILLIDEVLAVGDAAFQKKCLGKMDEVAHQHGRTVFFVSHNLGAVRSLCSTALLMEQGAVQLHGTPAEVISRYLAATVPDEGETNGQVSWLDDPKAPGNDEVRFRAIQLRNTARAITSFFEATQPITIEIRYEVISRVRGARFYAVLHTAEGDHAFTATDHLEQTELLEPGHYRTTFTIPGGLLNRRSYIVSTGCDVPGERYIIPVAEYLSFTVGGAGNQSSHFPEPWPGVLCPRVAATVERIDP
jgi:lipopolysaccharide transport system ATP-binding protein